MRPENLEDLKEVLCSLNVNGVSISEIMGCGSQKGWKEFIRGSEVEYNFLPKIKAEIVVTDDSAEAIIDQICSTLFTGEVGDGKIFISEIQDAIRIRTKERGEAALA